MRLKKRIDYIGAGGSKSFRQAILKAHPEKKWGAGFLLKATGWKTPKKFIKKFCEQCNPKFIVVAGQWEDSHRFDDSFHIKEATSHALWVNKMAQKFPEIPFYFSPWLEHREDLARITTLYNRVAPILDGQALYINNPVSVKYGMLKHVINELHHEEFKEMDPYKISFSFDGKDAMKSSVQLWKKKARKAKADMFGMWTPKLNGKKNLTDSTPRQDRDHYADPDEIRALIKRYKKEQ